MLNLKRYGSLVLVAGMLTSMMSACGTSEKKNAAANTASDAPKQIVEVSMLAYDRGSIPSSEGTLEDNWFTKEVNTRIAKLGLKIKYVPVPNAQREQKLATMLSAGEAPDICHTYDNTLMRNFSRNGGLTDLTQYVDKYGADLKKALGTDRLDKSKIDGKLTRIFGNVSNAAEVTFVRQDWLDKLGMKAPTNVNEFYNYLKAVKEKDPGSVGSKLVPFVMETNAQALLIRHECATLEGFLKDIPTQEKLVMPYQNWPEAKEMYRFYNKLYNEKLMDILVTDKDGAQYKQKLMKGEVGATMNFGHYIVHSAYGNIAENLAKNVQGASYAYSYPWKDSAAKEQIYSLFNNSLEASMSFFVPKNSKNAEAAVKFLNYMATDEFVTLEYKGVENTDTKVEDGILVPVDTDKFKNHVAWVQPAYQSITQMYMNDSEKKLKDGGASYKEPFRTQYVKNAKIGEVTTKYSTPVLNFDTPEKSKYQANLTTKWQASMAKFLTVPVSDFDKVFDQELATWKAEGGDAITKEASELFKKQNTK